MGSTLNITIGSLPKTYIIVVPYHFSPGPAVPGGGGGGIDIGGGGGPPM